MKKMFLPRKTKHSLSNNNFILKNEEIVISLLPHKKAKILVGIHAVMVF